MEDKLNKSISQIWEDEYVVPLYQRNYAWQEDQIQQLLQDIYDNSKNPDSHYFIGSLVVLQRPDNIFEVIDGQQRLTTLHLICKSLGLLDAPHLSYDSRPEVEDFFQGLFKSTTSRDFAEDCKKRDCRKISRLVEAVDIVETTKIHVQSAGTRVDDTVSLSTMNEDERRAFKEYLNNNVIIVRTILPGDTDVAAYFEIMNNRGEQLQEHEIVKSLMMRDLGKSERSVFSAIWDACSQMNVPIQKGLSSYRHNEELPLFGEAYDELHLDYLDKYDRQQDVPDDFHGIDEILAMPSTEVERADNNEEDGKYEPVIDFPNFLMHLFKMYSPDCPLNSDVLLTEYKKLELSQTFSPMAFIQDLLKTRVLFDRYIIKSQGEDEDENLKWIMHKPYKYKSNNSASLKFKNTYSKESGEVAEDDAEESVQRHLIMQESMLQVTFRNKKYKNWLFETLVWLRDFDVNAVDAVSLCNKLDEWILGYYEELEKKTQPADGTDWTFEALGTETPHFVLNFVDYLYWLAKEKGIDDVAGKEYVRDFVFKHYNSIEHHLPQSYKNTDDINVDNIANLCLISRSANSSLNDKAPKEKAVLKPGMYPKRMIMYQTTIKNNGLWGGEQISAHYQDIKALIDKRKRIMLIN